MARKKKKARGDLAPTEEVRAARIREEDARLASVPRMQMGRLSAVERFQVALNAIEEVMAAVKGLAPQRKVDCYVNLLGVWWELKGLMDEMLLPRCDSDGNLVKPVQKRSIGFWCDRCNPPIRFNTLSQYDRHACEEGEAPLRDVDARGIRR